MAEPFVFYFKPGRGGRPEILYMLDLDCRCGLCGHEQFQRFYHSVPFHGLTLEELEGLAEEGPEKAGYECENCGEEVGQKEVHRVALTFGFADEAGLVQIYLDLREEQRSYELVPGQRFDPQAIPRWWADEKTAPRGTLVTRELTEDLVEDHLGRPFTVKLAWRDLLEDWFEDPEGGAFSNFGPDLWVAIDESEESAGELAQEIDDDEFWEAFDAGTLAVISLHESIPEGLATHERPERLDGRWSTWLVEPLKELVLGGKVWADAYLSRTAALEALKRAFDVARLTYRVQETEADIFVVDITTPTGAVFGKGLAVSSVLRRAVYTGVTPGEAARLTAEEIIWLLLGLHERV